MAFTPLKDAIAAARGAVMEQVYANYDAELNTDRAIAFLSNPKSNDPFITFSAYGLDQDYIKQITDELSDAGWKRVTINKKAGEDNVWVVKAYRDDAKTAQVPAPQEPEEPGDTDPGDENENTTTPPAESSTDAPAESTEPTPTESSDSEPAQTPAEDTTTDTSATDTDASEAPAEEPAPASDSTTDSTTESGTTERQNPLLAPRS